MKWAPVVAALALALGVPRAALGCVGDDGDGDGVPDECDVCPEVADPLQADRDGDGLGDECDGCTYPDAADLLAAWKLDETTGFNARDASGNGREGTISPDTLVGLPGAFDTSFGFDPVVSSSVTVPYGNGALAPAITTITVSAWIRPIGIFDQSAIVSNEPPPGAFRRGYGLRLITEDGVPTLQFCWGTQDGPGICIYEPYTPALGVWSHVVATYDGATMEAWVDGELLGTLDAPGDPLDTPSPLVIGRLPSGALPFHGSIDQVSIHGRVLDPEEIGYRFADTDGDEVEDPCDLCPDVADPDQDDVDGDGVGDACQGCSPVDGDGDGVSPCDGDCADLDASVNPGAPELADGVDQDCDGVVDEGTDGAGTDTAGGGCGCAGPTSLGGALATVLAGALSRRRRVHLPRR